MSRLTGKDALVVGGGTVDEEFPGTGSATAIMLAREGAQVAVLGRTAEHTERTCTRITDAGGQAHAVLADVTAEADCARAVNQTVDRFGRLDVLVNNLGLALRGSLLDLTDEDWSRSYDVNLRAVVLMSKHAMPHLAAAGAGSVVNIGSVAGIRAAGAVAYSATKGALIALTQDMALMHGRDGVRVNCIVPGHLHTPMGTGFRDDRTRALKREANMLGVEGTGWDVGATVVFLAGDESRFITASSLTVDGGMSAMAPLALASRMMSLGTYG
jgi:NAD(P)-dependent dehydrogenase (short-subunit alcohol dehydrogenase family)